MSLVDSLMVCVLCLCWGRIALDDYRYRAVRPFDLVIVAGVLYFYASTSFVHTLLVFFILSITLFMQIIIGRRFFSFADGLMLGVTSFFIQHEGIPAFFIFLGGMLLLYHLITREERAPFLTMHLFLFIGFMTHQHRNFLSTFLP